MSVAALNIPPKRIEEKYRDELIKVEFDPNNKYWRWSFEIKPQPILFQGASPTPEAAIKAAKKQVDKVCGKL